LSISQRIEKFDNRYLKKINVDGNLWEYYKIGVKNQCVLFLSGGLRKGKIAFEALELLGKDYTVIAPNYPVTNSIDEIVDGLENVLLNEGINKTFLLGQSYGGTIAQSFLRLKNSFVKHVIVSSSAPLVYGKSTNFLLKLILGMIYIIPEKIVKKIFALSITKVFEFGSSNQEEYTNLIDHIIRNETTKKDIFSFFSTIDSLGKKVMRMQNKIIYTPVTVLYAEDDSTQDEKDKICYHAQYKNCNYINIGKFGHTAYIKAPYHFVQVVKRVFDKHVDDLSV